MKERGQVQGEKENKDSVLAICGADTQQGPGNSLLSSGDRRRVTSAAVKDYKE